ncbi:MAG: IS110 family transposase [Nitrospirae bacterium]|nr:MAG: IS110 family transposase [Nitrospirota bacterium]
MKKVFIGIDVAKASSNGHGLNASGETLFTMSFAMNEEGFTKLLDEIKSRSQDLSEVLVAMESTACYHINLFSFLTANGINAVVINPLLIANFARLSLRKTKTDKKDAGTIAQFAMIHNDSISQLGVTQDQQDLRDLARESESLCKLISIYKTEIKRLLQTLFPELETICDLSTKVMLDFLQEYSSAHLVRAAKPTAVAKVLKRKGVGTRLTYTAADLIQAAQHSVATVSPAKELILRGKVTTLRHLYEKRHELTEALAAYCKVTMIEELDIITSIPGINNKTATAFLAEIGNVRHYPTSKNLIAFAGIDPSVYQSGKYEGSSRISKRGNRHLRRAIWLMTTCVIQHNDTFRAHFARKRQTGQPYKKAVLSTAHKLVRVIYSMLSQRTHFREDCI